MTTNDSIFTGAAAPLGDWDETRKIFASLLDTDQFHDDQFDVVSHLGRFIPDDELVRLCDADATRDRAEDYARTGRDRAVEPTGRAFVVERQHGGRPVHIVYFERYV